MTFFVPRRPGILNLVSLCSFLLSFLNVFWILVIGIVATAVGVAGWILGPIVGLLGSLVALLFILMLVVQSLLSVLLFLAALKTWRGQSSGRSLHLFWAWIILVIDLIDLAFTGGIDGAAWVRLVYAISLIVVMIRDDIRAYFLRGSFDPFFSKS